MTDKEESITGTIIFTSDTHKKRRLWKEGLLVIRKQRVTILHDDGSHCVSFRDPNPFAIITREYDNLMSSSQSPLLEWTLGQYKVQLMEVRQVHNHHLDEMAASGARSDKNEDASAGLRVPTNVVTTAAVLSTRPSPSPAAATVHNRDRSEQQQRRTLAQLRRELHLAYPLLFPRFALLAT